MKAIIDLVIIGILVVCAWSGWKKGLIMGIGGILCIVVSVYGANLLAETFSGDVIPAMRPFASGFIEGRIADSDSEVMKFMGWDDSAYSLNDLLEQNPDRQEEFCAQCYTDLGLDGTTAGRLAEKTVRYARENGTALLDAVTEIACETVSYVGCFVLAFLLIAIILTVLGNLPNLSFRIPRLDIANNAAGAVFGLARGLMLCALLVWALKFAGIVLGDSLTGSGLGGRLLEKDLLYRYLGL